MIPPDTAEIEIFAGTDFSAEWQWVANGAGVDFTACSATFFLKVVPTDPTPLLNVSTTPSPSGWIYLGTPATQDAGLVELGINAAATGALTCPVAHGDLVITMSDGSVREFLSIDAFVRGAIFTGATGPAGGMAAPAGPPGMSGPGLGKTISAALYNVQPFDSWLRANAAANDVVFALGAGGIGEGEPHTFFFKNGPHNVFVTSPTKNIRDPQDGTLTNRVQIQSPGDSFSIAWDATDQEWATW